MLLLTLDCVKEYVSCLIPEVGCSQFSVRSASDVCSKMHVKPVSQFRELPNDKRENFNIRMKHLVQSQKDIQS